MDQICTCSQDVKMMEREAHRAYKLFGMGRQLQGDIAIEKANHMLDRIEECGCPLSHEIATMREDVKNVWM